MTVVVGPCFSMSASGLLGKALLYYDTKYGARIRSPKKTFVPPSQAWEVNKEWFKLASTRSKALTQEQRWAWQRAYPEKCDAWRDIFMGVQIERWNASPQWDLTWPEIAVQDVGDIVFARGAELVSSIWYGISETDTVKREKWSCNYLWWRRLDNAGSPGEDDVVKATKEPSCNFQFVVGHTNYLWGGVRYLNGTWKAVFLESFVK